MVAKVGILDLQSMIKAGGIWKARKPSGEANLNGVGWGDFISRMPEKEDCGAGRLGGLYLYDVVRKSGHAQDIWRFDYLYILRKPRKSINLHFTERARKLG